MLRGLRAVGVVVVVIAGLLLSACSSSSAQPTITPIHTATSSAQADPLTLDEAKARYIEYSKMSDTVLQEGGRAPERLKPFVTASEYKDEISVAEAIGAVHEHLKGNVVNTAFELQRTEVSRKELLIYVCRDLSRTAIYSSKGKDVTPKTRPSSLTLLVTMVAVRGVLEISESKLWSGASVC